MGLRPQDYASEGVEVWPDNWLAALTFADLSTQWRMGHAGPIGLDYAAIPAVLQLRRTPRAEWPELFSDLRIMEAAALEEMRKG